MGRTTRGECGGEVVRGSRDYVLRQRVRRRMGGWDGRDVITVGLWKWLLICA